MSKILKFIREEAKVMLPIFIYFAISINLIVLSEKLMIRENPPGFLSFTIATFSALIITKILLIADYLPIINAFPKKPLIYNIGWKFLIYALCIFAYRITEKFIRLDMAYHDKTVVYDKIISTLGTPAFWAIMIWFIMIFTGYITASEFTRVLGKKEIKQLLFGNQDGDKQ